MSESPGASEQASGLAQRVGFWLGLALFVGLLAMPTPESMIESARRLVGGQGSGIRAQSAGPRAQGALGAGLGKASTARDPFPRSHVPTFSRTGQPGAAGPHGPDVLVRARRMQRALAVTALVACWWVTVAIPIPATSLLPLALLPLLGVLDIRHVAASYADPNIFLFMGGFLIALAIERWELHRRIALRVCLIVGTGRATIVLGFMVATASLSMWISNTATTMMMLPIALAVIAAMDELGGEADPRSRANFAAALMLGIAYAASIGGIGTPIGTPPNIAYAGIFRQLFPDRPEISFARWTLLFVPLVIVFVPLTWLLLTRLTCPVGSGHAAAGRDVIRDHLRRLGRITREQWVLLAVGGLTGLLWMTRSIPTDGGNLGWPHLLERLATPADGAPPWFEARYVNDAVIAMAMALLLFLIPGRGEQGRTTLLDWATASRLPWGILLLFGGGFAIAAAFQQSGLSVWCGHEFARLPLRGTWSLLTGVCTLVSGLTEITSNTATTQVMLPIVANVAVSFQIDPRLLMLVATISASCAFMLPVATPPNAIVFGSGRVTMGRMVLSGLVVHIVGMVLIVGLFYAVVVPMLAQ